jgi:hypothetical protein
MATAAFLDAPTAINKTFRAGSAERKALTRFVTDGLNVNEDREACRLVVKHWADVALALKQTWGVY